MRLTSRPVHKPLVFGGTCEERSPQLPHPSTENTEENKGGGELMKNIIIQAVAVQSSESQRVSLQPFSVVSQVLERCRYELVVPLALLFSSTLVKVSGCRAESRNSLGVKYFYSVPYLTWSVISVMRHVNALYIKSIRIMPYK